jgi:hypothetical protein
MKPIYREPSAPGIPNQNNPIHLLAENSLVAELAGDETEATPMQTRASAWRLGNSFIR